ncbi:MAG: hypothetical protein E6713_06200 [Sporomusaceae bacterium]|nr:hypothetical protein [Sporomusaceae bacterium]
MGEREAVEAYSAWFDIDDYKFLEDAYYGQGGFKTGDYLVPHIRETPEKHLRRKRLAYYLNYVSVVVNSHVNPVFRKNPERQWQTNDLFSRFIDDVDTQGTPMSRWMKEAGRQAKLHGVCFLVMDNVADQPMNMADVIKNRAFPYVYMVTRKQVTNCVCNKVGQITEFSYTVAAESSFGSATKTETWMWTSTDWLCQRADGTIHAGTHGLGHCPVVPLLSRKSSPGKLMPQSEFYNIAQSNLALYNLCSEIRELQRAQAFAILTYPLSDDGQDKEDAAELVVGPENMLPYDGTLSNRPEYIAPPAEQLQQLREERSDLIKEIFRMAELSHVTGVETKNSGVAKAWDFEQANQVLADFALNCQDAEIKLAILFELWTNKKVGYTCKYSDDFGIVDVAGELDEVAKAIDLNVSPEFNVEAKKKAVAAYLNDIPEDRYDAVIADIEARAQDERYTADGTQMSDAITLLSDVSAGTVAPEAAVIMFIAFFGMDATKAQEMVDSQKALPLAQPPQNQLPPDNKVNSDGSAA